ncbi:MAG TPA: hypothetical protein VMU78_05620 [Methylocella sp.]|nr:hypothetical protein [Methylocella sp.]
MQGEALLRADLEPRGAFLECDHVEGMLLTEHVAGFYPTKAGDERPPLYYKPERR